MSGPLAASIPSALLIVRRRMTLFKEISESAFAPFFGLMAEIEHTKLNIANPNHAEWLQRKIRLHYLRGVKFFAYYIDGERPAGLVAVLHEEAPEGIPALGMRAEVLDIGVYPEYRRQGYGSVLLQYAENYLRDKGVYCMFMMAYAEDYDVIAFYGKNGFVPVATLPDTYGPQWEGNVFLRKLLK
ncbi:GNAT family N-acetyltransferase [Paenibacillus sp. MBLB4367]|uniref:GNAT family N-acetyltransferase n=1 Tax=Paenibacillus sp. MBLB4367 TaxID=3384767 RepID=UPI003907F826